MVYQVGRELLKLTLNIGAVFCVYVSIISLINFDFVLLAYLLPINAAIVWWLYRRHLKVND